jgi:D-alanyl-D-alanine carboxypeptidase
MQNPTMTPAADNRVDPDTDIRLSDLLSSVAARSGVHHATMAVVDGDGIRRWRGAVGTASPDGTPLRPETPFFIASITKRFIATLVLQAHEQGELDLDHPAAAYLPAGTLDGLHVHRGVDHTASITIRHLLSHTSGLPDYFEHSDGQPTLFRLLAQGADRTWSFDDVLRVTREQRPHFEPQDLTASTQRARYSDTGFQLLIAIVEATTGRSFDELLRGRILRPLGLQHTWLPGGQGPATATAAPARLYHKDRALDLPGMLVSCNDLMSTTGDLLRFQRALLAGELFASPATVALLTERSNLLRNMVPLRYGLGTMGLRVGRLSGPGHRPVTLLGHSGVTGTWLFHCPELDLHLAGSVDQATGRRVPFRLMARTLQAWHG